MSDLSQTQIEPLLAALDDASASVRLAAMRALVRLPLPREVWLDIGRRILHLLRTAPEGETFHSQTLDGIPYREVIEAAVFVPMQAVRRHLYGLLRAGSEDVRRATARALVKARDPAAVPQLVDELSDPDADRRVEAAQYLSLLDVPSMQEALQDAYRSEADGDVRFWLALTLARLGEIAEIEQVLGELRKGTLALRAFWGDPTGLTDQLHRRGPFPEKVRDLFLRIAQEQGSDYLAGIAMDLYWAGQPQPSRDQMASPDPELKALAAAILEGYRQHGELDEKLAEKALQSNILTYLPPDLASRLAIDLFSHAVRVRWALANGVVQGIHALQSAFDPDLEGLFGRYQQASADHVLSGLRWQIAWAVSRAGLERVLSELGPQLRVPEERGQVAAAQLIEETTLYVHQDYPPLFGGGSAPEDIAPHTEVFFEEEGEPWEEILAAAWVRVSLAGIELLAEEEGEPWEQVSAEPPPPRRVVNTGFAPVTFPDVKIDPAMPLEAGGSYYFWLDIGEYEMGSIEETPTDIPAVPAKARLTVTVVGFKDGIEIVPGADTGELEILPDRTVRVIRQPLAESPPVSRHIGRRLFFPVHAPREPGSVQMRCNIYWGQILLQSRVIYARVMERPERITHGPQALRSVLDYALARTLSPAHLLQLTEHRLSILLNSNGDGTHSFHLYGTDGQKQFKQDDVRFREGELQGMITQARGALRTASWGSADEWQEGIPYRYKDGRRSLERLREDLTLLAKWGYEFYTTVRGRLAGGEQAVEAFEQLMRKPGLVQMAMKESPSYVLPAALIYDYPLDVGETDLSLCPAFEDAFQRARPLEDVECFQGNCPSRGDLTVVCPSGFWGFRHYLGMPLSIGEAPDAPPQIVFKGDLRIAVGVATDLELLSTHTQALQQLRPGMVWDYADTRRKVFSVLKGSPHLVYFYCHGGLAQDVPYLRVGSKDLPGLILPSNFYAYEIVWNAPRPLVFINGCHTTAVEPLKALQLIGPLVTYSRSAGVIGTEVAIFEELATAFARECLRRFIAGECIGAAIRGARLELLGQGNPLGLVYIPFVMAGLRLVDQPAI